MMAYEQVQHNNRGRRLLDGLDAGSKATATKLKPGVTDQAIYDGHRNFSQTAHPQGAFWVPAGTTKHTTLTGIRDEVYIDLTKRYSGLSSVDVLGATSPARLAADATGPLFTLDVNVNDENIDQSLATDDDSALLAKVLFPASAFAAGANDASITPSFKAAIQRAAATKNDALQLRTIVIKALLAFTSGLVKRPIRSVAQLKALSNAELESIHKLLEDQMNPSIKSERGRRLAGQAYAGASAAASLRFRFTLFGSALVEGVPVDGNLQFIVPLVWATQIGNQGTTGSFAKAESIYSRIKQGKAWGFNLKALVGVQPTDLLPTSTFASRVANLSDYVPRWAFPLARTFFGDGTSAAAEIEFAAQFEAMTDRTAIRVNGVHASLNLNWSGVGLPSVGKTQENAVLQEAKKIMSYMDIAPGPKGYLNIMKQGDNLFSSNLEAFWHLGTTRDEFEHYFGLNLWNTIGSRTIKGEIFNFTEVNPVRISIFNPNVATTQMDRGPWRAGWTAGWPTFLIGIGTTFQQGGKASMKYSHGPYTLGVDFRLYLDEKLDAVAGGADGLALDRAGYDDGLTSK